MGIGKQIRHYRDKAGWTLDQLSELSEVDRGTISALEIRDSSRSKYFPAIAKAFGLSVEQLADEKRDFDLVIQGDKGTISVLQAKAPDAPPYMWPFRQLKPPQWNLLTPEERDLIESNALALIKARGDPKHQAPENYIASA